MPKRPIRIDPFIRFVCEGDVTEPNYFNGMLRAKGLTIPNAAFKPKDHSPIGIAKEAARLYNDALKTSHIPKERVFICAIFDCDGHVGITEAFAMLRSLPIQIGFSNACFEFWVLLHFERTSRPFSNCDEIITYIRRKHDADYRKNNDHFNRLRERIPIARENAKWLCEMHWQYEEKPEWQRNPFTTIHQLLHKLDEFIGK